MTCQVHSNHGHTHGANCGHTAVKHGDHVDYLHDGHLHHVHGDHIDEHVLSDSGKASCGSHSCDEHDAGHKHGASCGHEAVPHGDHVDYIVNGHLHHACADHCDDHGSV